MEAHLHDSVIALLQADPDIRARLGDPIRFADGPARGLAYPYAAWGVCETRPADAGSTRLLVHRASLRLVGREGGAPAMRDLVAALRKTLIGATPDPGPDWRLISFAPVYADVLTGRRPPAIRGLIRLRAVLEAAS